MYRKFKDTKNSSRGKLEKGEQNIMYKVKYGV